MANEAGSVPVGTVRNRPRPICLGGGEQGAGISVRGGEKRWRFDLVSLPRWLRRDCWPGRHPAGQARRKEDVGQRIRWRAALVEARSNWAGSEDPPTHSRATPRDYGTGTRAVESATAPARTVRGRPICETLLTTMSPVRFTPEETPITTRSG